MKQVAVTHNENQSPVSVIAWFDTVAEAEQFIASCEKLDPTGVYAGDYGIDAPEELI